MIDRSDILATVFLRGSDFFAVSLFDGKPPKFGIAL